MSERKKRKVAILGSTGSIGTQTLEVIESQSDFFEVEVLTAYNNIELLINQAQRYQPNVVIIGNESKYDQLVASLEDLPVKVYAGIEAIAQVVEMDSIDIVLTAMVGSAGLDPTINAIKAGKRIALANKETLVVAGRIITQLAAEYKAIITPVDSEHSAIFQCLVGEAHNEIEKIILTASGGPFRTKDKAFLKQVNYRDALKHPNWDMGNKITIDSATLMNKGLEAIEARWLFGLKPDQIEVVIHPQSILHSLVQFTDGSIKAQMGLPDMKLPILYALSYPERLTTQLERFSFTDYPSLTFEKPDTKRFRNLAIAFEAMKMCGNAPAIMNASNEIAVDAFLNEKIGFLEIADIVEKTMNKVTYIKDPGLEDLKEADSESRMYAQSLI